MRRCPDVAVRPEGAKLGDPELPHQVGAKHHALLDARWTRDAWVFLAALNPAAGERRVTGRKNSDQFGAA
jgi:hypothetical protein